MSTHAPMSAADAAMSAAFSGNDLTDMVMYPSIDNPEGQRHEELRTVLPEAPAGETVPSSPPKLPALVPDESAARIILAWVRRIDDHEDAHAFVRDVRSIDGELLVVNPIQLHEEEESDEEGVLDEEDGIGEEVAEDHASAQPEVLQGQTTILVVLNPSSALEVSVTYAPKTGSDQVRGDPHL